MGVALTKQAVATRLLKQAVRAYLRGDDPIAVYLQASCSARLLSDLLDKAGVDWLDKAIRRGIFDFAVAYARGEFGGPKELEPVLASIAEAIAANETQSVDDLALSKIDAKSRRALHRFLNREYNFLKHADIDALASIDEDQVDPFFAIVKACVLFQDMYPNVDVEEVYLFKYLFQRRKKVNFSSDVRPFPEIFEQVVDDELEATLLNYLEFEPPEM